MHVEAHRPRSNCRVSRVDPRDDCLDVRRCLVDVGRSEVELLGE